MLSAKVAEEGQAMRLVDAEVRLSNPARSRAGRRGLLGVAALVAAQMGGAVPASAQIASGYSGTTDGGQRTLAGDERTWQILRVYGACFARNHTAQAFAILAAEPNTTAETEALRQAMADPMQYCLGYTRRMRAPRAYLRGAIAEGLLKRGTLLPADLVLAPPPPGAEFRHLNAPARCYAAAHPDRVRALLETPLGSRSEAEAANAILRGGFAQCLPERARRWPIEPTRLRYLLAEALLRMRPAAGARG